MSLLVRMESFTCDIMIPSLVEVEIERSGTHAPRVPAEGSKGTPGPGNSIICRLCQHIAAAHGGHVAVESRPGEGTTFGFVLPLVLQAEEGASAPTVAAAGAARA